VEEKDRAIVKNDKYGMVSETYAEDCIIISPVSPAVKG